MQTRAGARQSGYQPKRAGAENLSVAPAKKRRPLADLPQKQGRNVGERSRSTLAPVKAEVETPSPDVCGVNSRRAGKAVADENVPPEPRRVPSRPRKAFRELSWNVLPKGVKDIDKHDDPLFCGQYAADIVNHHRIDEQTRKRIDPDYMVVIQRDVNPDMRSILVDWLVEVAEEYKLVPDTLYLTVAYVDQYLSSHTVTRQRLQLVGVTCMWIAAKYEEVCSPRVEDFCYITDNTYTREQVIDMEKDVLRCLQFDLTFPTTKVFLRRCIKASQFEKSSNLLELECMANFLSELALVDYTFLQFRPSLIAASAVFIARIVTDPNGLPWFRTLQYYSGYAPSELEPCVKALYDLHAKRSSLAAIREKYGQSRFKNVASLHLPPLFHDYFDNTQSELSTSSSHR